MDGERRDNEKMKRDKVVQTNKLPFTSLQFIHLIDEQWGFFQDTNDNEEKITHMMNTITLMFMWMVLVFDYKNYLKYMNNEKEE